MISNESYILHQGWMITELGLQGDELTAYALVYGFSQDGESTYKGSGQYLAEWIGKTERVARETLNNLAERGFLIKKETSGKRTEYSIAPLQKLHHYPCKNCTPPLQKLHTTPAKIAPLEYNIENNIENKTTTNNNAREKIKGFILDNTEVLQLQLIRAGVDVENGIEKAVEPLLNNFIDWMIEIGQDNPDRLSRTEVKMKWRSWLKIETKKQKENVQQENSTGKRSKMSNNDYWADLARRMGE